MKHEIIIIGKLIIRKLNLNQHVVTGFLQWLHWEIYSNDGSGSRKMRLLFNAVKFLQRNNNNAQMLMIEKRIVGEEWVVISIKRVSRNELLL